MSRAREFDNIFDECLERVLIRGEAMEQCLTLELQATMRQSETDVAQVFYRRPDDAQYDAERSSTVEIGGGERESTTVALSVTSEDGFASQFRFDPVFSPQEFELADLEIRCRWSAG